MPVQKVLSVPDQPLRNEGELAKLVDPRSMAVPLLTDDDATLWKRQKELIPRLYRIWANQKPQSNPCVEEPTPIAAACILRWLEGSGKPFKIETAAWQSWTNRYPTLRERISGLRDQLRNLTRLPNPSVEKTWNSADMSTLREAHARLLADLQGIPDGGAKEFNTEDWKRADEPISNPAYYIGLEVHGNIDFLHAGKASVSGAVGIGNCAFKLNDLVLTLGRFGLKLYINGKVEPSKEKNHPIKGYVKIQAAGYRMTDRFGFEGEQSLGFWDGAGFRSDVGGIPLNNHAFRRFRDETGKGLDFDVFTDIIRFDLSELGIADRKPIPFYITSFAD